MPAEEITFAELIREAGYQTACIGKWDVSNRKAIIERMPNAQGFDYFFFLVVLVTFPDLQVFAGFAQKEDFAVLGIRGAWKQDKNGLFLFDAAEVKQVGVRMQGQRAIGVGGQNVVGVGEGDCPNRKPFRQPFSMLGE